MSSAPRFCIPFTTWLRSQLLRDDLVGRLAIVARHDPLWPRRGGYDDYLGYLESLSAPPDLLDAFEQAYDEFKEGEPPSVVVMP